MRTLRTITARLGHETSGSDLTTGGHDPNNVKGANLVVFTGAISADNPELSAARENGVPTIERSEYLAAIAASFGRVIAIAGSHGKTTTTALTAEASTRAATATSILLPKRASSGVRFLCSRPTSE